MAMLIYYHGNESSERESRFVEGPSLRDIPLFATPVATPLLSAAHPWAMTDPKRHHVGFVPSKNLKPADRFILEED
jgi:hypothetical protein